MSEKIQPIHIEREACVYIRQSSMQQVRDAPGRTAPPVRSARTGAGARLSARRGDR